MKKVFYWVVAYSVAAAVVLALAAAGFTAAGLMLAVFSVVTGTPGLGTVLGYTALAAVSGTVSWAYVCFMVND